MKRKPPISKRKHRLTSKLGSTKEYLTDSPIFASRFANLMQAIQNTPKTISHTACEELLEFYVDSEQHHENVRELYPLVWKHLQTCKRCQSSYEFMNAAQDSSVDFSTKLNLPFLAPANPNALWNKKIRPRVGGAPLGFNFVIQAAHLTRTFNSPSSLVLRGDGPPSTKSLILSDVVTLPEQEIAIDVWLYRPEHQDTVTFEISAVSSTPLAEPMQVALAWNDHRFTGSLQKGQCIFDSIPLSELQGYRDLRVEFEAKPQSLSPEA